MNEEEYKKQSLASDFIWAVSVLAFTLSLIHWILWTKIQFFMCLGLIIMVFSYRYFKGLATKKFPILFLCIFPFVGLLVFILDLLKIRKFSGDLF